MTASESQRGAHNQATSPRGPTSAPRSPSAITAYSRSTCGPEGTSTPPSSPITGPATGPHGTPPTRAGEHDVRFPQDRRRHRRHGRRGPRHRARAGAPRLRRRHAGPRRGRATGDGGRGPGGRSAGCGGADRRRRPRPGRGRRRPGRGRAGPDRRLGQQRLHRQHRLLRRPHPRRVRADHRGDLPRRGQRHPRRPYPDATPRPGEHRAGHLGAGLPGHPPAERLLRAPSTPSSGSASPCASSCATRAAP